MKYRNLAEMFFSKRQEMPDHIAYKFKKNEKWIPVTYEQAVNQAERIAGGFANAGIKKNDKIAIISNNCMQWALCDYAAMSLGAILVPVYPSLNAEQALYIINNANTKIIIAENKEQTDKIDEVRDRLSDVQTYISFDETNDNWNHLSIIEKQGENFLNANPGYIEKSVQSVNKEDIATFIYTSGTTGEPKGVVLTHNNLLTNATEATKLLKPDPSFIFLSFLPLSHSFERLAGHIVPVYTGCTTCYAESLDKIAENLQEVKPVIMTSVPRFYEKMYSRILETVESGSVLKRKIFYWSLNTGKNYIHHIMYDKTVPFLLKLKQKLAYKLVFAKLNQRVGGNLKYFVSGGAPLSPVIAEFFGAAGLIIYEGYGLTETSPIIAVNRPGRFRFGSVGPPLPGVEVKIANDGEILSRGPNTMKEYYKKEAETKEMIDDEGWLHTGDIGYIDDDGFLYITDRKKNLLVTSGGKNIAPAPIENSIITSKFIEQAVMIGDKRRFCSAVIVCDKESLINWAQNNKITFTDYADLIKNDSVKQLIRDEIKHKTDQYARYEKIKEFVIVKDSFTIENGELTPSLKVKRNVIAQKYAKEIEEMYQEG